MTVINALNAMSCPNLDRLRALKAHFIRLSNLIGIMHSWACFWAVLIYNPSPSVSAGWRNAASVFFCRPCSTAWWTPWRTCWISSSSTFSSCSSSPLLLCSFSRASSSTARTNPKTWRRTAGRVHHHRTELAPLASAALPLGTKRYSPLLTLRRESSQA